MNKRLRGLTIILLVAVFAMLCLGTACDEAGAPPEGPVASPVPTKPPSEIEGPIEDIVATLAAERGVAADDVEIRFCEPGTTAEDVDLYAVGAVINNTESLAFFYDSVAHQITAIEASYVATTDEEILALSIAARYTSRWTGNKIVPCEFTWVENEYTFKYYDGYYGLLWRWSFGWGTVDLEERTVAWGPHV